MVCALNLKLLVRLLRYLLKVNNAKKYNIICSFLMWGNICCNEQFVKQKVKVQIFCSKNCNKKITNI